MINQDGLQKIGSAVQSRWAQWHVDNGGNKPPLWSPSFLFPLFLSFLSQALSSSLSRQTILSVRLVSWIMTASFLLFFLELFAHCDLAFGPVADGWAIFGARTKEEWEMMEWDLLSEGGRQKGKIRYRFPTAVWAADSLEKRIDCFLGFLHYIHPQYIVIIIYSQMWSY